MRTIALALCLFPGVAPAMDRTTADTLIGRATVAYTQGDHAGALALFDSVHQHWRSVGLAYAIGNCHFKLDHVPEAIVYYERALLLEPGAEDVKANLELARQRTMDRVNELPAFRLGGTWERWIGGRDVDQWARRALWVWSLAFIIAALALLLRGGLRTAGLALAAGSAVFSLVAVGLAARRLRAVEHPAAGIVMQPRVDVRSEPREAATTLFMLHSGTKVSLGTERSGWVEVTLANGNVGWMPAAALQAI